MLLQEVAQGPGGDAEKAAGARAVALALLQRTPYQVGLDGPEVIVEAEAFGEGLARRGGRGRGEHLLRQALREDGAARLQGHRTLDDVLELAYVARPRVVDEARHRI